mmetsp:Transcript_12477/g.11073  ORF Transcript_12477/g.11073 Transcript_12477/m.11073 type:complete len:133 (-) Transcript_12477:82-480(-)
MSNLNINTNTENNNNDNNKHKNNINHNNNGHIGIGIDNQFLNNLTKLDEQTTPISNSSNGAKHHTLSFIHDEFEIDDIDENEIGDNLTSLPNFGNNSNHKCRNSQSSISISSNGSHASHSRDISSASTLDID